MKFICPLVVVEDINKAKDFYINILGQRVRNDFGENVIFESNFAIHQKAHFQKLIQNREIFPCSNSFELYFEADDIEEVEKTLVENHVEFLHNVQVQPWQQKVCRIYDLDGNIIEIGESMKCLCKRLETAGNDLIGISALTGLAEEKVKKLLQI